MTASFEKAVAYVLLNEGGYSNVPEDAGGPTNYGITQADLTEWYQHPVSADDVKNMSVGVAKAIYYQNYWLAMNCDKIESDAIATCIFDSGVLYGIGTSERYAQNALCNLGFSLEVDSKIGPLTLAALNSVDASAFIKEFYAEILNRIDNIIANNPQDEMFRAGWMARANRLLTLVS